MEVVLWVGWRVLMAWGSGETARRKGYAGWPYVLLGMLLGLGGLLLTFVATRSARHSLQARAELERLALQNVVSGGEAGHTRCWRAWSVAPTSGAGSWSCCAGTARPTPRSPGSSS